MPALGTGFLKYPAGVVAETTLKCLEEFNDNNQATKLRDVSVIVYYKDIESYQVREPLVVTYLAYIKNLILQVTCWVNPTLKYHTYG